MESCGHRPRARGRHVEAREAWKRVQPLRRHVGDSRGQLNAMEGIAHTTRQIDGPSDSSVTAFEAALDMASTLGEWRRALTCRNTLGILEWTRDRFADALKHYEAALLLAREHGDRVEEGVILNSLGITLSKLNRPEEARTVLEESVTLNQETGQRLLEAHALTASDTSRVRSANSIAPPSTSRSQPSSGARPATAW